MLDVSFIGDSPSLTMADPRSDGLFYVSFINGGSPVLQIGDQNSLVHIDLSYNGAPRVLMRAQDGTFQRIL